METLIHHFKIFSEQLNIASNDLYFCVEAPKGEFGIYFFTNGTNHPLRCKIKAPGFYHLQALNSLAQHHLLADLVAIIGSLDVVFGEIDR